MRQLIFEVPEHLAVEIEAEVASGNYETIGHFVAQSVESKLRPDRYLGGDANIEQWLTEHVGPTYDAYKADPNRLLSEEAAFRLLDGLSAERASKA